MPNQYQSKPEFTNFTAEQLRSDQALHGRLEFSFSFDEHQFTGHFHGNEIAWMQPSPRQVLDSHREEIIESRIRELLTQRGDAGAMQRIAMEEAFEGRTYERRQVSLNIQGTEYKGFVQDGDIHWFQPHPTQKLGSQQVEAIESDIRNQEGYF